MQQHGLPLFGLTVTEIAVFAQSRCISWNAWKVLTSQAVLGPSAAERGTCDEVLGRVGLTDKGNERVGRAEYRVARTRRRRSTLLQSHGSSSPTAGRLGGPDGPPSDRAAGSARRGVVCTLASRARRRRLYNALSQAVSGLDGASHDLDTRPSTSAPGRPSEPLAPPGSACPHSPLSLYLGARGAGVTFSCCLVPMAAGRITAFFVACSRPESRGIPHRIGGACARGACGAHSS